MQCLERLAAVDWLSLVRVLACVSISFAEGFQMSLNGPFYPEEALDKGLDQAKIGLATGAQYLARLMGSILVLKLVNVRNQNFYFIVGAITAGLMSIAIACLAYVPGVWPFFILSTLGRFLIGIFSSGVWGTGFSVITSFYPSSEGLIVGIMETAYGAGQMIGPIIGNLLYTWKSFPAPFNVAGIFECILAFVCIFAIPDSIYPSRSRKGATSIKKQSYKDMDKGKSTMNWSVFTYVIKLEVILASLPITTVYSTVGFVSVALGPYLLRYYDHDSTTNGRFFFSIFGAATIFSLLFGFLIDKGYCGKIYLLSIFTGAFGYFMLFIPQFFESARYIGVLYTALVLIGISAAAAYTGSFLISEKAALLLGTIDEAEVRLYVLNGLSFWISIGITSGQVLTGGVIYNHTNFNYACLAQCLAIILAGIPSTMWMWRNNLIEQVFYHNPAEIPEIVTFVSTAKESRSRNQIALPH